MDDDEVFLNLADDQSTPPPRKIKSLPPETVKRIQSEQVVTDIASAIKELVEYEAGAFF
jgi:hypothetical protein